MIMEDSLVRSIALEKAESCVQNFKELPERDTAICENWKCKIEEIAGNLGCTPGLNILGLFFVLFFINDLPVTVFNCKIFPFADDLKLLYNENLGNAHGIKQDIVSILRWS